MARSSSQRHAADPPLPAEDGARQDPARLRSSACTWPRRPGATALALPAYPHCPEVIEAVIAERMKLADLAEIRARKRDRRVPRGLLA